MSRDFLRFCLPLHSFIKKLLAKYGLVSTQIHPNVWKAILNFLIKCLKVKLELWIKALRLVLALKFSLSNKSIVYASYKRSVLAFLISKTLYRWSDSFFVIHLETGS